MEGAPKIALATNRRTARHAGKLMRRLAPPPVLSLPDWAAKYRRLSSESSAEPGRWDNSRAAYQVGMMAAISDPRIERVVLMTSARVGKTQACVNNMVGYAISMDPGNILVVLPTEQRADEWSDDEFAPMVRDTPVLREILGDKKSRSAKDRRKHKSFPGGRLYVVGANAPSGLAAKTIRYLCADEIDRFPASSGGEGDAVSLAIRRTNTAANRKIILSSTPTDSGTSRIEKAFEESDQRRFWVPCPHCSEMQVLRWDQVRWENEDPSTAAYYCVGCGAAWNDAQRWAAVRKGEWRAEKPFRGVAGFHVWEAYSPWRKLSETAADFLAAKRGGPEQMKVWINTALGEVWHEQGDAPDWERLLERREPFPMGVVPKDALVLTAGVDNQTSPARLEYYVWAWGPGYTSWLVDAGQIDGSPGDKEPWDKLAEVMNRDWPIEDGGTMRVAKWAPDTGGTFTTSIYGHLRRLRDPRCVPVKGVPGWNKAAPVTGPTLVDVTEHGRKIKRGLRLYTVAVDSLKADVYRRLWLTRGDGDGYPPGWVHLPEGMTVEQVKQLVAEHLITVNDRRGYARREWAPLRPRNEALDCSVYARAALTLMGSDRFGDRFWKRFAREEAVVQPPPPSPLSAPPLPVPAPVAAPAATNRPRGSRLA